MTPSYETPYVVEIRDRSERWHRPRLCPFHSAAYAIKRGARLAAEKGATGFRVVNRGTGRVEYVETIV